MMPENNTCVCCGRVIPEGKQICLQCSNYDDMQTFKRPEKKTECIRTMMEQKVECIRTMMEQEVTDFVWQYICRNMQSCPAHGCHECVMNWLRKRADK